MKCSRLYGHPVRQKKSKLNILTVFDCCNNNNFGNSLSALDLAYIDNLSNYSLSEVENLVQSPAYKLVFCFSPTYIEQVKILAELQNLIGQL